MNPHSRHSARNQRADAARLQRVTVDASTTGSLPAEFVYVVSAVTTPSQAPTTLSSVPVMGSIEDEHALILAHQQRRRHDPQPIYPDAPGQAIIDLYPRRQRVRVRRRKRHLLPPWWLLSLLLIGGGSLGGWFWYHAPQADGQTPAVAAVDDMAAAVPPTAAADSLQALRTSEHAVIAKAMIKPQRAAALGFPIGGRVKEILVAEGDVVTAGQPLVRLDDTRQLVAIAQARAGLQQAQAQLFELQAGARREEIAAAQAIVDGAQARLDLLLQEPVPVADEAAAQAELAAAEVQLQQLYLGPEEATLIGARAEMRKAEAALATAQAAYDAVAWRNDIAMLPESMQLQQATIDLEAAQATYVELARGANPAEISSALAAIEMARANLARVQQPVQGGEIDAARAELRQAQAELDLLRAGARAEAIVAGQSAVSAAQAVLLEAEVALNETLLRAPFVGTIATLDVEIGEQVGQGVTVVQLGDFSTWQLETDDLVELDVVRVKPGAPVAVTIDALPEIALRGEVVRVKPIGENKVGDMTYTVYIALDQAIAALAWNMSATVYIAGN